MTLREKITESRWYVDLDHTHGRAPFTIATGSARTGTNWQPIGTARKPADAALFAGAPIMLDALIAIAGAIEVGDAQEAARDALAELERLAAKVPAEGS